MVLEHQIQIWLDFVLGFSILELESCDTCTRTEPILQIQRTLKHESCDMCTRMDAIFTESLKTQGTSLKQMKVWTRVREW